MSAIFFYLSRLEVKYEKRQTKLKSLQVFIESIFDGNRRIQLTTPNDITARADFYFICDDTEVWAQNKLMLSLCHTDIFCTSTGFNTCVSGGLCTVTHPEIPFSMVYLPHKILMARI